MTAVVLLGAGLIVALVSTSWSTFASLPCTECRVPTSVLRAISRDPALRPLPGATHNKVLSSARCFDSATETGVGRTFKPKGGNADALAREIVNRAKRLGWRARELPDESAWFGARMFAEKEVAGASARLSVWVGERGAVDVSIYASCTER